MENKYNPEKMYGWSQEAKFEMDGRQFGFILNTLRAIINTPEAQKVLMASKAHDIFEELLSKAIEDGIAVEKAEDNPNSL